MTSRRLASLCLMVMTLGGCASVRLDAGFPDVRAAVEERQATTITWSPDPELDPATTARIRALLDEPLTAADAVQIALLNHRELQALYTDLGLAQADVVQAGLFRNPVLDAAMRFPLSGLRPDLQFGVVVNFLDALYRPRTTGWTGTSR